MPSQDGIKIIETCAMLHLEKIQKLEYQLANSTP